MNILMSFKMAVSSIVSNKARSALTMLGIIIGVLAVIVMVNLVTASTMSIKEWMDQMAQNVLEVNIWNSNDTTRTFKPSDMAKLAAETDGIEYQTPSVSGNVSVKNANRTFNNGIEGVNEHYADIMRRELAYGSFFSETDVNLRMPVAVIGEYVRQSLFGMRNPVGQDIKIGGEIFKVVGVLEQKNSELSEWGDDAKVYIPYTKALRLLKRTNVDMYYVSVEDPSQSGAAQTAIENALYNAYQSRDYWVYNQAEHMQNISSEMQGMTLLAAAIAGISLLVGGIGIMNIMLVSVTERTKSNGEKSIG
ncbi:MAG: ABC transporter permease [Clostridia bacterium]|nr:ABC transporter permease [Clostridia bacterium]